MSLKYSVLVIDDQKNWRDLLTEILEEHFEVISVNSYDEALATIRNQKHPFHVLVTDMRLVDEEIANEDGLKLIKYLNQRGDETKTIVITGYATIDTTKRALSHLAAYDYLEKRPSDGSPFNAKRFQQIVYEAAEEAEKKRPHGLTDITQSILLLEPDSAQRKKLKESLSENGYQVSILEINENLTLSIKTDSQRYALILLSETLSDENLLTNLHSLHPDAKIIILTSRDINSIFKAMRDYPILSAFNVPTDNFDSTAFRELIHSALAYGTLKYILAQIEFNDLSTPVYSNHSNPYEMVVGNRYNVTLSIQDTPTNGAASIALSPRAEKKGKIQLRLSIHTKQMNLEPGAEVYWEFPLSDERPDPLKFSVTPQAVGKNEIAIEIDQNHQWLGRVMLPLDVSNK